MECLSQHAWEGRMKSVQKRQHPLVPREKLSLFQIFEVWIYLHLWFLCPIFKWSLKLVCSLVCLHFFFFNFVWDICALFLSTHLCIWQLYLLPMAACSGDFTWINKCCGFILWWSELLKDSSHCWMTWAWKGREKHTISPHSNANLELYFPTVKRKSVFQLCKHKS